MLHGSSQFQLQVLDNVRAILIGIVLHSHAIPLLLDGICPGGSNPLGVGLKQHTGLHSRLRIPRDGGRVRAHTVRDLIARRNASAPALLLRSSVSQSHRRSHCARAGHRSPAQLLFLRNPMKPSEMIDGEFQPLASHQWGPRELLLLQAQPCVGASGLDSLRKCSRHTTVKKAAVLCLSLGPKHSEHQSLRGGGSKWRMVFLGFPELRA